LFKACPAVAGRRRRARRRSGADAQTRRHHRSGSGGSRPLQLSGPGRARACGWDLATPGPAHPTRL